MTDTPPIGILPEAFAVAHPRLFHMAEANSWPGIGRHGPFIMRDQKPLDVKKLERCLTDVTASDWLVMLDKRLISWPTEKRVGNLLNARVYQGRRHLTVVVDTAALWSRRGSDVELSPINTGSTACDAKPRGSRISLPLAECPFEARRSIRGEARRWLR